MANVRLKDNHPTSIKLEKLFALADELGISISTNRLGCVEVTDNEWPGKTLYLKDADNGENVSSVPPVIEYKIVYPESLT